jgi:endonuclease YncB( thermonuclease family)
MNILTIRGTLALSQFWPAGLSDADTAHLKVEAVYWQTKKGAKKTRALEHAVVHGKVTKPAIRKGKITVRLQGLDAPELHYRPSALVAVKHQSEESRNNFLRWNFDFRQSFAEQSVLALKGLLESAKKETIPCWVETRVEELSEAFDCYGRLVGDLWVNIKGEKVNLNHWLLRHGWAFPAIYNSMTHEEMQAIIDESESAREGRLGVWNCYSAHIAALNWGLQFRKEFEREEKQKVILPKMFRRLVNSSVNQRAGFFHGSFRQYLTAAKDGCYLTDDFLKNGAEAKRYTLEDFLLPRGRLEVEPHQLVFIEASARLSGVTKG